METELETKEEIIETTDERLADYYKSEEDSE